jgi:GTP-binding protein EngB required for normal cell division
VTGTTSNTPANTAPANATDEETLAAALKVLQAYGLTALTELARRKTEQIKTSRSVVVVGEVKRGKSSLVNALFELPELSPVESGTSVSLHLVPESEQLPRGWAELVFPGQARRVPATELPGWVTQNGRFVTDPEIEMLPTRAVISVRTDPFAGAVVVDTPGVGGLDSTRAQLALGSVEQACVLVMVADATAPLTAPEMEFLKQTSAGIESIIVVVSKTDKNVRRWKAIVEENRRLIKQHLHRELPVVGVSSMRALAACRLPPGLPRDRHLQGSGIDALRVLIRQRLALGDGLAVVDGMRTALEGLRDILGRIAQDTRVAKEGEKVLPELTRQKERLEELRRITTQWEINLTRDMTFARTAAMENLDQRLEQIRNKWNDRVYRKGMEVLRKNPQVFTAEIEVDLMDALGSTVTLFVDRVHDIAEPLFDSPEPWADIYQQLVDSLAKPEKLGPEVLSKRRGLFDPTLVSMGMGGGSSLTHLALGTAGIAAVSGPFAAAVIAAGVVWMGLNLGFRVLRTGRQNLLNWLRETLLTTRMTAGRTLEVAMVTAKSEIVLRYRSDLRARTEDVTKQLNAAQAAAKQDAATREKTLQRYTNNERIVNERIAQLESAIARLTIATPDIPVAATSVHSDTMTEVFRRPRPAV